MTRISRLFFNSPARYLLFLAAILQLTLVLGLYTIGRLRVLPNQIDESGLLKSAMPDTRTYQNRVIDAVEDLKHSGVRAWLLSRQEAHVKLYSLSYLICAPLFGNNILSAEPLNLGCYLAILILVAKLGQAAFDRRTGRAAAGAIAVWPSFQLHGTQVLKDPISIVAMLILIGLMVLWLTSRLSWRRGLAAGLIGGAAVGLVAATRGDFWAPVILGLSLIGAIMLIVRQLRQRSLLAGNALSMIIVVLFAVGCLSITEEFGSPLFPRTPRTTTDPSIVNGSEQDSGPRYLKVPRPDRTNYLVIKTQAVRDGFALKYADSGSMIDPEVEFITVVDVLRYVPRAMEIGFLAPFPNTWLADGKEVGRPGRLLSGAEMLVTYVVELLGLFGVWRARRRLSTWMLVFTILFGLTTLGFGLINLGALYRMRYCFVVLLLLPGMYGLTQIRQSMRERSFGDDPQLSRTGSFA